MTNSTSSSPCPKLAAVPTRCGRTARRCCSSVVTNSVAGLPCSSRGIPSGPAGCSGDPSTPDRQPGVVAFAGGRPGSGCASPLVAHDDARDARRRSRRAAALSRGVRPARRRPPRTAAARSGNATARTNAPSLGRRSRSRRGVREAARKARRSRSTPAATVGRRDVRPWSRATIASGRPATRRARDPAAHGRSTGTTPSTGPGTPRRALSWRRAMIGPASRPPPR